MSQIWDNRLITPGRAMELAGDWPVYWDAKGLYEGHRLALRCGRCRQSCGIWPIGQPTNAADILAAVLRHMVMAHDQPLNIPAAAERSKGERTEPGAGGTAGGPDDPRRPGAGGRRGHRADRPDFHRHRDQTPDPGREQRATGDDQP